MFLLNLLRDKDVSFSENVQITQYSLIPKQKSNQPLAGIRNYQIYYVKKSVNNWVFRKFNFVHF